MHRDDDEAWRAIVENYGDRAVIEPEDEAPPAAPTPASAASVAPGSPAHDVGDEPEDVVPVDERFVPPDPDPFPMPPPDRLAAWIGVLGTPLFVLFCVAFSVTVPAWAGVLLACAFVGGFLYLVARLPSGRDPWDDGARV